MEGRHKTIPVFVPHLGCPCDCIFCNQRAITGQRETMTPEKAEAIIEAGTQKRLPGDVIEIGFFGGSFTGISTDLQEALLKPAFSAVSEGRADGIRLSTRPDYIDEMVLLRLKRYGVTTVELGAQSMNDDVLCSCNRGHTATQTEKAAQMIRQAGFNLGLQMMLGLPGDSFEGAQKTAEAFINLGASCVRIYPTLVLKQTALAQLYESGNYTPLSLNEAVEQCAVLYQMFRDAGVEVIRMGLLDTEPETVCAGPFHPAFGELVMARACYNRLKVALNTFCGQAVTVKTNPRFVSILVGQKRENIIRLQNELNLQSITIVQDETIPFEAFLVL